MRLSLALLLVCGFVSAAAAQCPTIRGMVIPCGTARPVQPTVPQVAPGPTVEIPAQMFMPEQVARDVAPEHLAFVNDPTWANAQFAAILYLYRQYRALAATYLIDQARRDILHEVEQKTGMTQDDLLPFFEAFAKEYGLPLVDLRGIEPPPLLPDFSTLTPGRVLAKSLQQKGKR